MTKNEFATFAKRLVAAFPQSKLAEKPDALALYGDELAEIPLKSAKAALVSYERDGREFAPTAGQVYRRVAEMEMDAPTWGDVHASVKRLLAAGMGGPYAQQEGAIKARLERLEQGLHPLVSSFLDRVGRRVVYESWGDGGNGEARLREKWREYVKDVFDLRLLHGVDAPLARVERARRAELPGERGEPMKHIGEAIHAVVQALPAAAESQRGDSDRAGRKG